MFRLALVAACLILWIGAAFAQASKPGARSANDKMKTVRLHIDGFQKSKSGAV
jgi:hypothetical protein